jgi:hypothetical protein
MTTFLLIGTIFLLVLQIPIIFFLVLVIRSLNIVFQQAMSTAGIGIGRSIPKFERKSLTSDNVISNEWIKGKPALIGFVSHSCKRCKAMLPFWNEAYEQHHQDINFLLIGHGSQEQFAKMLQTQKVMGELVPGKDLFNDFKSKLVAFAYYVDADGKIVRKGLCENKDEIEGLLGVEG